MVGKRLLGSYFMGLARNDGKKMIGDALIKGLF